MQGLKFLIFLVWTLTIQVSLGAGEPKVVLLTSLDPSENRPPLRSKNWDINEKLEGRFHRYLKRYKIDLKPQVIHFADQVSLFNALQSEDVKALIWVSHAGYQKASGLSKASSIIDYRGRDLKGVFQASGPSIKFLGLVGCQGQGFIEEWKSKGWPSHGKALSTFSRIKKTDARKGLKLAMKSLGQAIENNRAAFYEENQEAQEADGDQFLSVRVTRKNFSQEKMNAVQVYQRGKLLTVLPASHTAQDITFKISMTSKMKKADFKIVLDSGESSLSQNTNLGRLQFASPFQDHWKLFATPDGKPFGVGTNIYINKISFNELTPNI